MAGLYDGIEEVAFKRIAGGYVFQSNNPWLIGPRRRYFVNETQKAEIAACIRQTLRRIKPFALVSAVLIPLVLVAGVLWLVLGGGATPGAIMLYTALLALGLFVPYIALVHAYSMRRLRPLIAGLPRVNERITISEGTRSLAVKASFKMLVLMLLGPVLIIIGNAMTLIEVTLDGRSLRNPEMMLFSTAMCTLAPVYFSYLLIVRMRQKRSIAYARHR
jgi:hypothetical protein